MLGLLNGNFPAYDLVKIWSRAASIHFRNAYIVAFLAERCAVGRFLLMFPSDVLAHALNETEGPHDPDPGAAALRDGALLYEVAGENFSGGKPG